MELSCIITRKAFYLSWHLRLFLGAKALKHILSHPRCSAVGGQLDHPCLKYFVFHKESFLLVKFKYSKFYFFFFLVFRDRISLCSPGYPGTHFVDQAGLELRNPPASASRVLGLKVCATTPGLKGIRSH